MPLPSSLNNKATTKRATDASTVLTNGNESSNWMDRTIPKQVSQFLTKNACRLCSVYADEQVAYESVREQQDYSVNTFMYQASAAHDAIAARSLDVQIYKQFLFDEDSVLESLEDHVTTTTTPATGGNEWDVVLNPSQTSNNGDSQDELDPRTIHTQRTQ